LFLRAAHEGPENVRVAEITEEFLLASMFHDKVLRDNFAMVVSSPSREDTPGNTLMVRYINFTQDPYGAWRRETQQLYVANSNLVDAAQTMEALSEHKVEANDAVDVLSRPLLIQKERFPGGIADLAQMHDAITSERTGRPVFCGIPIADNPPQEQYQGLMATSLRRERELQLYVGHLAEKALRLARSDLSFAEQRQQYEQSIIDCVREICKEFPDYAEAAFGELAAKNYKLAKELRDSGDYSGAEAAESAAVEASTTISFCDNEITIQTSSNISTSGGVERLQQFMPFNASLETKYGLENIFVADCLSCEARRVKVGPCQFCNVCDSRDRAKPGYIKDLMDRKAEKQTPQTQELYLDVSRQLARLKKGELYDIGGETYVYQEKTVVGGSEALFMSASGAIEGERAAALKRSLQLAA
jgi:hypothetical protein